MQTLITTPETINETSQRISQLEKIISKLERQIEDEREAYIKQLKEAKLEKIKEYQALVDQLKNRCKTQNSIIETLSNKLNCHHSSK